MDIGVGVDICHIKSSSIRVFSSAGEMWDRLWRRYKSDWFRLMVHKRNGPRCHMTTDLDHIPRLTRKSFWVWLPLRFCPEKDSGSLLNNAFLSGPWTSAPCPISDCGALRPAWGFLNKLESSHAVCVFDITERSVVVGEMSSWRVKRAGDDFFYFLSEGWRLGYRRL